MTPPSRSKALLARLDEALDLLADATQGQTPPDTEIAPLTSLLASCEAAVATAPQSVALRSIHHFACTGGTLISKCLSVMPNVVFLSELDPLSSLRLPTRQNPHPSFMPSDLIYAGRVALRPISDATAVSLFQAGLRALITATQSDGLYPVLRDHAHSQFCTDQIHENRPTLHEILSDVAPVRSVVTVRHPLESFLSLQLNKWLHFTPQTFEAYCDRYLSFLDRYSDVTVFKYEDFVADPQAQLQRICTQLALPFHPDFETLLQAVEISGDSGRKGTTIAPRDRRPVPEALQQEIPASPSYFVLCERLEYDATVG